MCIRDSTGIGVSPGRVVGPVVLMPAPIAEPAIRDRLAVGDDRTTSAQRIATASAQVRDELTSAAAHASGKSRELLEATAMMAADPLLVTDARRRVPDRSRA